MSSTAQAALHFGSFSIPVTVALVLVALIYARGWNRLRKTLSHLVPVWRISAFMTGLFLIWLAAGSSLATLDHELLSIHMVQHLLLMSAASPLILLAAPALPLLYGLPQRFGYRAIGPLLRCSPVCLVGRVLTHPVLCWLAGTVVVIGWHIPTMFELGLRSHWWHGTQQASFLAAGLLFWMPVIQFWPGVTKQPRWSIPLYLFLATLPCDALSAFLTFCDRVVYPSYLSGPRLFDISALHDQEMAGALMWVCVTLIYLVPAVVFTMHILTPRRWSGAVPHRGTGESHKKAQKAHNNPNLFCAFCAFLWLSFFPALTRNLYEDRIA